MGPPGVALARCFAACGAALWWAHTAAVDAAVSDAWGWLVQQWWFRHDSFEPVLSVLSFVLWIPLFYTLDRIAHRQSKGGTVADFPLAPYMIQPDRSADMNAWRVEGTSAKQLVVYLAPICAMDAVYPRRGPRLEVPAPSSAQLVGEVFLALFLYDFFFTLAHYACHKVPWLWRYVHAVHHERQTVRARDTLRLSILEETVDVLCSIAALNAIGAHPLTRAVYDVAIVYLLCELHSGWDFPWMLQNVVPGEVWGGSRRHAAHHVEGSRHYQKFYTYLDDYVFQPAQGRREGPAKALPGTPS
eukprot:TRINITY_DN12950_c0_g1_i1.p1 TRINITY_DN12950_c0_g1~~TRINITY_DN12950_c0_g1_i1.p1  ORF type:complete len:301 (+),score=74.68 TRINITY_DN12950_c0_g1_i1:56-958(+)